MSPWQKWIFIALGPIQNVLAILIIQAKKYLMFVQSDFYLPNRLLLIRFINRIQMNLIMLTMKMN